MSEDTVRINLRGLHSVLADHMKSSEFRVIKGKLSLGLKQSSFFTNLPWVREQFMTKLGIDPYLGTLNLDIVDGVDMQSLYELKKQKGIQILPGEPGFCAAKCFPVLVYEKIKGAIVIPQVFDYPESKLEIVSSHKIRGLLSLEVGDVVAVHII